MVISPKENHRKDLVFVNPQIEDSSTDTSSDIDNVEDQEDDSESITVKTKGSHNNVFTLREMDGNIGKYIPGNSHINVENSSDVVIGSLTQFNGPVTIVQNGNSKKILGLANGQFISDCGDKDAFNISPTSPSDQQPTNSSLTSTSQSATSTNPLAVPYNPIDQFWTSKRRCLIILVTIAVLLVIIAFTTTLTLNHSHTVPSTASPTFDENTVTLKPLGKHLQITREQWGGRPILNNTRVLKHPTPFVLISHTAGVWCKNFRTCSNAVQILQSLHVSEYGSPDIGYNFLIGGDANIYVGRGWDIRNFHTDNNIGITFIGNFVFDSLTPGMIEACQQLLEDGVQTGKLATNYTLIGHNQTYPTQSPGDHIVAIIKTWPHWKDGDFLDI